MATRFYFRNATAANPPTAGDKATLPSADPIFNANSGDSFESLSLEITKGAAQTTKTIATTANNTQGQASYIARFTSDPLAAQTISAPSVGSPWEVALCAEESNASANAFMAAAACYVWRPGTSSVVGYVWDDGTGTFGTELGTSQAARILSKTSGSSVSTNDGDVLVYEVWTRQSAQAHSTSYTLTIYFDGTTDVVAGTTSDAASYIETPQNLTFQGTGNTYTKAGFGRESA